MEINLCFTTCLSIVIQQLAEFKKHFYVVNQESVANQLYFYISSVWLTLKYLFNVDEIFVLNWSGSESTWYLYSVVCFWQNRNLKQINMQLL